MHQLSWPLFLLFLPAMLKWRKIPRDSNVSLKQPLGRLSAYVAMSVCLCLSVSAIFCTLLKGLIVCRVIYLFLFWCFSELFFVILCIIRVCGLTTVAKFKFLKIMNSKCHFTIRSWQLQLDQLFKQILKPGCVLLWNNGWNHAYISRHWIYFCRLVYLLLNFAQFTSP